MSRTITGLYGTRLTIGHDHDHVTVTARATDGSFVTVTLTPDDAMRASDSLDAHARGAGYEGR